MPQQTTALTITNDMDLMTLGKVLAASGYFQDSREAAQAIVKVMAGAEMGFPPIASMNGIHIIKGRISMSANLMASAIKRHKPAYDYRILIINDEVCKIEFFEDGQSVGVSEFTIKDARRAATQNLDKYPRNMLFARAMSNGAKWYCAGVFGGPVWTPDELDNDEPEVSQQSQLKPTNIKDVTPQAAHVEATPDLWGDTVEVAQRRAKLINGVRKLMNDYADLTDKFSPNLDTDFDRLTDDQIIAIGKQERERYETVKQTAKALAVVDTSQEDEPGAVYDPATAIVA